MSGLGPRPIGQAGRFHAGPLSGRGVNALGPAARALMLWKPFLLRELLHSVRQVLGKVQANASEQALVA